MRKIVVVGDCPISLPHTLADVAPAAGKLLVPIVTEDFGGGVERGVGWKIRAALQEEIGMAP